MARVPGALTLTEVQAAFRDLAARVDKFDGPANIDLQGRRIINAGRAKNDRDYLTKGDTISAAGTEANPLVLDVLTVRQLLTVTNLLRFRTAAISNPSTGVVQVTRGDGATFGALKTGEVQFSNHVRLKSVADDVLLVRDKTDAAYATIEALKFLLSAAQTYTPTNVTPLRGGDFSALSTDDVRSIVGTLITDLQTAGLLA